MDSFHYSMNIEGSKPLYMQLFDMLLERIMTGVYKPEEKLPSERELSEELNISRMTVREALKALVNEGYIYTQVGKGTYVTNPHYQQDTVLTSFTEQMRKLGKEVTSKVIEFTLHQVDVELGSKLELNHNEMVYKLKRIRLANNKVIAIETAYLPQFLCPGLDEHDFSSESLYTVLRSHYGMQLLLADQVVVASMASADEYQVFDIDPPAAVLRMKRITRIKQKKVVEYVDSVYRGDSYVLVTRLSADII
ncbi:MAG: GntR family transcriptional regulator [Chloroflexi bacterium]|nr:GntR family transcriptional regulator [Chloroflexota bacterium]